MNHILLPFIGKYVVFYFDDILIYNPDIDKHIQHLREVLDVLCREKILASTQKCVFMAFKLLFLGFVVSA